MQKDKHTFKRARLYFTSSSVCTFQSDCIALLPSPCQAACFTSSSTLKALTVFATNFSNACIFPRLHLKVCVSAQTHRSSFVLCVRECLCVCAFAPRSLVPTSQRAHLAPVRPPLCAASARFVGTLQPQLLLSRFHCLSFFLPTPRTSRRKHCTYLPTLPLLSHQQAECSSA